MSLGPSSTVCITSAVIFVGAYGATLLPGIKIPRSDTMTAWPMSKLPPVMHMVDAIAAGLLCGAALCIILPEGFKSFYGASLKHVPEWVAALCLLGGFAFMLVIEAATDAWTVQDSPSDEQDEEGLRLLERAETSGDSSRDPTPQSRDQSQQQREARRTLFGLVIHAAADGIAAGAASLSGTVSLSVTVSLAILLHKFPVAWSLSIFLRKSGLHGWELGQSLLLFSLSSPVFLLSTFFVIRQMVSFDQQLVSLVLLFSGGSVCFVAFLHVIPSALKAHSPRQDGSQPDNKANWVAVTVVLASFVPLLMAALLPDE